jgi:hypothetical protein
VQVRLHALQALCETEGWRLWIELLKEQEEVLVGILLQPIKTMDGVLEQQYMMGQLARSMLHSRMIDTLISELQIQQSDILNSFTELKGDDDVPSTRPSQTAP